MVRLIIIITSCLMLMISCTPYPDEDYFEPLLTDAYLLDAYQGATDFTLDNSYDIASSDINRVSIPSNDGKSIVNISGIFIGDMDQIDSNHIIVYCHDKSGNIDTYWQRAKLLANLGLAQYGILIIDYRGYGISPGTTSEASLTADVSAAINWLEDRGLTNERLILYGFGLGSVPVIEIAAQPRSLRPEKIILEAPIASMESLLQDAILLAIPSHFLTELSFNNADKIKKVDSPLLWFHGTADKIYPIEQGEVVYRSHKGIDGTEKLAFRLNGATHNNIPAEFDSGFPGYLLQIQNLIESL